MNKQEQYSSTNQILQAFFSKPLTLIFAITFALTAIIPIVAPLLTGEKSSFDIYSIAFSIAFFMLYFKSKTQTTYADFKAPLTLIKVASIIYTCTIGATILLLIICIPMLSSMQSLMPAVITTLRLLILIAIGLMIFYFLFNLGFSIFACSMKKTYNDEVIKRTGSVFTGITGFLYIIAFAGFTFLLFLMSDLIFSALSELLTLMFEDPYASANTEITITSLSEAESSFASDLYSSEFFGSTECLGSGALISPFVTLLNIAMTSIYALYYNAFMKKAAKNYVPSAPVPPASNAGTASSFGFSSQPTYPGQSYASTNQSYSSPNRNNYGGPAVPATMNYSRALAPEIHFGDEFNANEDRRICPTCGSKVELALDFCPQCGFKFIIQEQKPVEEITEPTPVEEPIAPVETPAVEAPVAEPIQTPAVEAAPVAEPIPTIFNSNINSAPTPVVEPVAPVQKAVRTEPTIAPEQPFVAPFQTVDTAIKQPSVSEQPLVTPFFNSNTQPARNKSKSDDEPKPYISNSNLKR